MEEVVAKLVIASFIYSIICPQIFIESTLLLSEYKVVNKTKEILPAWNIFLLECGHEWINKWIINKQSNEMR